MPAFSEVLTSIGKVILGFILAAIKKKLQKENLSILEIENGHMLCIIM